MGLINRLKLTVSKLKKLVTWQVRYVFYTAGICIGLAALSVSPITQFVADRIFQHLDTPTDGELPLTYVDYPAGPDIAANLGGRGEGLSCSIPGIVRFVFSKAPDGSPVELEFRQACAMHDLCYRHGYATYGYNQADCDYQLQEDAYRLCRFNSGSRVDAHKECELRAKIVLLGVRVGGAKPFRGRMTSTFFEYNSTPNRAREFKVARLLNVGNSDTKQHKQRLVVFNIQPSGTKAVTFSEDMKKRHPSIPGDRWTPGHIWRSGNQVWIPPGLMPTAPMLVHGPDEISNLVWLARKRATNTDYCIVEKNFDALFRAPINSDSANRIASAFLQLTNSGHEMAMMELRKWRSCVLRPEFRSFDIHAASPVLLTSLASRAVRIEHPVIAGVSANWRPRLSISLISGNVTNAAPFLNFLSKDTTAQNFVSQARGQFLHSAAVSGNFIGSGNRQENGRQILIFRRSASEPHVDYTRQVSGVMVALPERVLNVPPNVNAGIDTNDFMIVSPITVSEAMKPLAILPGVNSQDRLIGFENIKGKIQVNEVSFFKIATGINGLRRKVSVYAAGREINLSSDWIDRPALVMKPSAFRDGQATGLIFSRAMVLPDSRGVDYESVRFEFAVARRSAGGWHVNAAARCEVQYFMRRRSDVRRACETSSRVSISNAASVGHGLRGAQLVAGRFEAGDGILDLAIIDPCYDAMPLILKGNKTSDLQHSAFSAMETDNEAKAGLRRPRAGGYDVERTTQCTSLPPACLSRPMFRTVDFSAAASSKSKFETLSCERE